MKQYIDKDALVTKIRNSLLPTVIPQGTNYDEFEKGADSERVKILSLLDTLEVKEINPTDAFIEKATNFLNYKLSDVVATRVPFTIIPHHVAKQELIEDFVKTMKGE